MNDSHNKLIARAIIGSAYLIAAGLAAIVDVAAPFPKSAVENSDESTEIDRRAPCCPTCKVRMRRIAATQIADARQIEVTSPWSPCRLRRPAE